MRDVEQLSEVIRAARRSALNDALACIDHNRHALSPNDAIWQIETMLKNLRDGEGNRP